MNHNLQFKGEASAKSCLTTLFEASRKYHCEGVVVPFKVEDDFGATFAGFGSELRSLRLVDIAGEHKAAQELELHKAYGAKDFQERMQTDHRALSLAQARTPALIR